MIRTKNQNQDTKVTESYPNFSNQQTYGNRSEFIVQPYGQLKMLFLLFDIQADGEIPCGNPTAFYFPQVIELIDNNSFVIARTTATDSLSRLDEYDLTLANKIINGANIPSINTSLQTITLPLFFWPIDGNMIDTSSHNLRIRYTGKNTRGEMGFRDNEYNITSFNIRLRAVYDNYMKVPLDLSTAYNTYQADEYQITYTETSKDIILNVPYLIQNIAFSIRKTLDNSLKKQINKVVLRYSNGAEETYSTSTNYYLGSSYGENFDYIFNVKVNDKFSNEVQVANRPYIIKCHIEFEANTPPDLTESTLFVSYRYKAKMKENTDNLTGMKYLVEIDDRMF